MRTAEGFSRRSFLLGAAATALPPAFGGAAKPVFRAGLLTDTHVTDDPKSQRLVRKAMALFRRERVDLICHLGDLADVYSPKGWEGYRAAMEEAFGDGVPEAYYAFGGHDRNRYVLKPGETNREETVWKEMRQKLKAGHELYDVREFRGYRFVIVQEYLDGKRAKDLVDRAVRDSGTKPVFVLFHEPAVDTVLQSVAWGNSVMRDILDRHPSVVHLSGHVHGSNRHERQIWQGSFTEVGLGCLQHWTGECANANRSALTAYDDGVMTMDVYPDAIVFHRFSLTTGEECRPLDPWTVPLPFDPKSAPYRPEVRKAKSAPPTWGADAAVAAEWTDEREFRGYRVAVPEARHHDGVFRYTAELFAASGRRITLTQRLGQYWKLPESSRAGRVAFDFEDAYLVPGGRYRIAVTPEDFFGNRGKALSVDVTAPDFRPDWGTVWSSADGMRDLSIIRFAGRKRGARAEADAEGFVSASDRRNWHPLLTAEFPAGVLPAEDPAGTVYRLMFELEVRHELNGTWRIEVQDCTGRPGDDFYLPNLPAERSMTPNGSAGMVTYVMHVRKPKAGPLEMRLAFSYGAPMAHLRFGRIRIERRLRVGG